MNEILEFLKWLIESYPLVLPGIALVIGWVAIFGWPKGLLVSSESLTHYPEEVNYNSFPNGRKRDSPLFHVDFSWMRDNSVETIYKLVAVALLGMAFVSAVFTYWPIAIASLLALTILVFAAGTWSGKSMVGKNGKKR